MAANKEKGILVNSTRGKPVSLSHRNLDMAVGVPNVERGLFGYGSGRLCRPQ
jgi:hypothetical protein